MAIIQIKGEQYEFDIGRPLDISIPLRFNGPQPNAYSVEPAASQACEAGDIVGDTRRGGSCNFEQITLIPHCNGTHTECVGHITDERISIRDCLRDAIISAVLVSVEPQPSDDGDLLITRPILDAVLRGFGRASPNPSALIVRTLPNDESKSSRLYGANSIPPYFASQAMELIVEYGFKHLLVDLPSIDRLFDDGKLTNHRIFWNVEPGSFETNPHTRINSTITELICVPNEIADGEYLLNLQIAPFESDAAPSRPILFAVSEPPARAVS